MHKVESGTIKQIDGAIVMDGGMTRVFAAMAIRSGLNARRVGMFVTRGATTAKLLLAATQYTGNTYKRGDIDAAHSDLTRWIEVAKLAITSPR